MPYILHIVYVWWWRRREVLGGETLFYRKGRMWVTCGGRAFLDLGLSCLSWFLTSMQTLGIWFQDEVWEGLAGYGFGPETMLQGGASIMPRIVLAIIYFLGHFYHVMYISSTRHFLIRLESQSFFPHKAYQDSQNGTRPWRQISETARRFLREALLPTVNGSILADLSVLFVLLDFEYDHNDRAHKARATRKIGISTFDTRHLHQPNWERYAICLKCWYSPFHLVHNW